MTVSLLKERTKMGAQPEGSAHSDRSQARPRACLWALGIFFALNIFLSASNTVQFDPYKFTFRGWPWWIFNDLRNQPQNRNVALMGSSLMVDAVSEADTKFLNRNLEETSYHNAAYLDHLLSTKFGGSFRSFNLAIPGQMVSDAYMTLRAALDLGQHPSMVVYGIAPRDFIDSTMQSPLDTESYHYLSRLVNLEGIAPELYRQPFGMLNRALERCCFFYGHSLDFQIAGTELGAKFVNAIVPTPPSDQPFTYWDRRKLLPDYMRGELYPTAMVRSPDEASFSQKQWKDNTDEYTNRFKHPNQKGFNTQLFFLVQLAKLCKSADVTLVLVNMPTTKNCVDILGQQRYSQFLAEIDALSRQEQVAFFDLNDLNKYSISDFQDLVHLNSRGATKFFDNLAQTLTTEQTLNKFLCHVGRASTVAGSAPQ